MKKFVFKFAGVQKLRKTKEQECLRSLAQAQSLYQEELNNKARCLSLLKEALERRESLGSEPVGIASFQVEQSYIIGMKQKIQRVDQALVRASREVQKALRAYLVARKENKAMQTLHDQAKDEYKKLRAKYEAKQQDELTIMRTRLKEEVL